MTKKIVNYLIIAAIGLSATFTSCDDPETEIPKKSGFSNAKEFVANPSVSNALKASGIVINDGNKPPIVDGTYFAEGEIVNAADMFKFLVGFTDESEFVLSAQVALGENSGKINVHRKDEGDIVWGKGAYITGDSEKFTIYLEIKQNGIESKLGLPEDISFNVVFLVSGNKLGNRDLTAQWITIITDITIPADAEYDSETLEGSWFISEGNWRNL